jgi:DNA-binding NarL/FixJ family response regulator
MIRVIIADDHTLVRRSIHALLDRAVDIEVVGEAQDGIEVLELTRELKPDLVIMDVSMPKLNGIAATAQIQKQELSSKVVILSMHANQTLVQKALQSGAQGYLLKRTVSDELLLAIHQVFKGEVFLSRSLASQDS